MKKIVLFSYMHYCSLRQSCVHFTSPYPAIKVIFDLKISLCFTA